MCYSQQVSTIHYKGSCQPNNWLECSYSDATMSHLVHGAKVWEVSNLEATQGECLDSDEG